MRIHRVEMTAFGPFKDSQQVEFDAFAIDGLFLIAGKTGSGKTSILDAVCFGLYGSVPRFEKAEEARYRSDHAAPEATPVVAVEFTVRDTRYRVERSPSFERPKLRGAGTTTVQATSKLFVWEGDDWRGTVSGNAEVGREVLAKVQLSKDQFLQVMLLAQNRFQEFLVAESKDRRTLLQMLFRTERFQDYEEILLHRRRELDKQAEGSREVVRANVSALAELTEAEPLATNPDDTAEVVMWVGAVLAAETARVAAAGKAAEAATKAAKTARDSLATLVAVRDGQLRRDAAREALERAASEANDIGKDADRLEAATRAEVAWPTVELARKAAKDEATKRVTLDAAQDDYVALLSGQVSTGVALPLLDAPAGDVVDVTDRLTQTIGVLDAARTVEGTLPELERAVAAADALLAQLDERAEAARHGLDDVMAARTALEKRIAVLTQAAADRPLAKASYDATEKARDAAKHADELQGDLDDATAAVRAATAAVAAATGDTAELWRRRVAGMAGELASELTDGAPCQVCGSIEHPAPAVAGELVTQELLDAADIRADAARSAEDSARSRLAAVERQLTGLRVTAGSRGIADLEEEFGKADARLQVADEAVQQLHDAQAELMRLDQRRSQFEEERDQVVAARGPAVAEQSRTHTVLSGARTQVADACGEFPLVEQRVAALRRQHECASALTEARVKHVTSVEVHDEASHAAAAAMVEHRFADAVEVEAARLSRPEVAALGDRVAAHNDRVRGAEQVLTEDAIVALPEDLVDIAPAQMASDDADAARTEATTAHGGAMTRAQSAWQRGERVRDALEAAGELVERLAVVQRLAATVHGEAPNDRKMRLEDYVLAANLEEIVGAANGRLSSMTTGRYELVHSDAVQRGQSGLGLLVMDQHTGAQRSTQSLSGGEKFLASLALALGLAETVSNQAGGITIDTLFVDEGFGSLDAETLEVAMETLDSLRAGGRTVGVISHVEAMHEAIPARLDVVVEDGGWSTVRQ